MVIDLDFGHLMTAREHSSLATQLQISYSEVVKRCAPRPDWLPIRLAFTSSSSASDPSLRENGAESWPVHRTPHSFAEALPLLLSSGDGGGGDGGGGVDADPSASSDNGGGSTAGGGVGGVGPPGEVALPRLVVLSPDAEEPLDVLRPTEEVYVIGGLCDYKRIVGATSRRAAHLGVTSRRLPIAQTFGRRLQVDILTVDQVVVCLLECANNGGDWEKALRAALPPRKLADLPAAAG